MKNEIIHNQAIYVSTKDVNAEKLESYKSIFQAFSTLSDAQELIALGSPDEANDLINKAKSFINDAIMTGDAGKNTELYSQAMTDLFLGR
tara:strand:- start:451 stop:720 length:270 start_codon:yes stop_codon:yes gene_type:complete